MPSPNDLPTSSGPYSYMHDGAITFMDHYDLDVIVIRAYDRTIFADGVCYSSHGVVHLLHGIRPIQ